MSMHTHRFEIAEGPHLKTNSRFVDRAEFLHLLVGKTKLVRDDDRSAHLRGLYDPVEHKRFLIEEDKLFPKL